MELAIQAAIGFVAGLLGGLLGVGGSIIIIPGLILYLSQTGRYEGSVQHLLQAAAMISNVFVAAPSVLAHWRARAIMRPVVVFLIPAALAGILLGVYTSDTSLFARQNGVYLALVLAGFMIYVAGYNGWRLCSSADLEHGFPQRPQPPVTGVGAVGLVMGFFAGLLGIGGGAICVPMQQVFLRIPLRRAIANSALTIVCVSSIGALFKNITLPIRHDIPVAASLQLALMLIPTAILGSYIGGKLTHALPRRVLRLVFIVFMLTMAYLTFTRAWEATPSADTAGCSPTCTPDPRGYTGQRLEWRSGSHGVFRETCECRVSSFEKGDRHETNHACPGSVPRDRFVAHVGDGGRRSGSRTGRGTRGRRIRRLLERKPGDDRPLAPAQVRPVRPLGPGEPQGDGDRLVAGR